MAKLFLSFFCSLMFLFSMTAYANEQDVQPEAPESVVDMTDSTVVPRILTLDLTRDANDIWDRIRRGFGMADIDSELVAEQQLFYLNRPAFLKQVFERGGRYLYYIVDELERRGMPTELALLPMVESSYNPLAYSPAHASGLWQFIPSTGKNYNLTQDRWVDERRDIVASTHAALDYLQTIYEMHGDWHLALASYNWGEGAVGRAIKYNLDAGLPTEYSSLRMPNETRNYVPKLQAIKNIISQPELFHFELPYVANEVHFVAVPAPVGIDLATAAELADLPLEEFIALNPGFNRPAIISPGQSLIVPVDHAAQFEARLQAWTSDDKNWGIYELKPGEKLDAVARRYELPLAHLLEINGLTSKSKVSPGYRLLVPEGVDPSGALRVNRLLPNRSVEPGQSNLKIKGSKDAPKGKGASATSVKGKPARKGKAAATVSTRGKSVKASAAPAKKPQASKQTATKSNQKPVQQSSQKTAGQKTVKAVQQPKR